MHKLLLLVLFHPKNNKNNKLLNHYSHLFLFEKLTLKIIVEALNFHYYNIELVKSKNEGFWQFEKKS
jgi:hypothetical protein